MGFIKSRHEYLIEQQQSNSLKEVEMGVKDYLEKHLGLLAEYGSEFNIEKQDGQKLKGKLFFNLDNYGVRFNWKANDISKTIISIDLWKKLKLGGEEITNKPSYTFDLNGNNVLSALKSVTRYFGLDEYHKPIDDSEKTEYKPNFIFGDEARAAHKKNMEPILGSPAKKEKATPDSIVDLDIEDFKNIEMDVFEEINKMVWQIAQGYGNSLIITGQAGVGKSYDTLLALKQASNINANSIPYTIKKGGVSASGLFDLLFRKRNELIVLDDYDKALTDAECLNMLKGALDSGDDRVISRDVNTHFNTDGMTMKDIVANYEGKPNDADHPELFNPKNKGKMPKEFLYEGRIIFISNLSSEKIEKMGEGAILSRASAWIDVQMTHDEVLERIRKIMKHIAPEVPMEKKEELLRLIDYITSNFETKYPLSIRTLVVSIDTMVANNRPYVINGKSYPEWQILIKQNLLRGVDFDKSN